MQKEAKAPFFSVILPTRNRPQLFREALESILNQSFQDVEIQVINDGSDEEYLAEYKKLEDEFSEKVKWHYQPRRPNGHGQSYSMNTGAYNASGKYICFLDDDDSWCDSDHLTRAHEIIASLEDEVDVLYTNQIAYNSSGDEISRSLWIAPLSEKLTQDMKVTEAGYRVTPEFLFSTRGFAHLNCTIIRRDFYIGMKGMDENIRYECDRDLYLRTVDVAKTIIYSPFYIARHNVPDPKKKDNMSTLVSDLEKRLYQLTVLEKALLLGKSAVIRKYATGSLCNTYKHISSSLAATGQYTDAVKQAYQALAMHHTIKWHCYCLYLRLRAVLS